MLTVTNGDRYVISTNSELYRHQTINNMKKKFRTEVVRGISYGWTICGDEKVNLLRIWQDKKIIHTKEMRYNFDGDDTIHITPRVVRKVIIEMLNNNLN